MDPAEKKQSRWISSLRIITVVGYIALMVALMVVGQMTGYSSDTMERLVDHILALSFMPFLVVLPLWGLLGKSIFARWSRADMDKGHFGVFLLAVVWAGVGMVVMAQHGSPGIQKSCFDGVSWLIGWSMGLEYRFLVYRKPAP